MRGWVCRYLHLMLFAIDFIITFASIPYPLTVRMSARVWPLPYYFLSNVILAPVLACEVDPDRTWWCVRSHHALPFSFLPLPRARSLETSGKALTASKATAPVATTSTGASAARQNAFEPKAQARPLPRQKNPEPFHRKTVENSSTGKHLSKRHLETILL